MRLSPSLIYSPHHLSLSTYITMAQGTKRKAVETETATRKAPKRLEHETRSGLTSLDDQPRTDEDEEEDEGRRESE